MDFYIFQQERYEGVDMQLDYKKGKQRQLNNESSIYQIADYYEGLKDAFIKVKVNVCDLNPAQITKCITGTEQDYFRLMEQSRDYIDANLGELSKDDEEKLLDMFKDCIFGYYILTPLINDKSVSDIKILDYNHIVIKAHGNRYVTDISFLDENDYETWLDRLLRIHDMYSNKNELLHFTDRKGAKEYYLRIDVERKGVISTEKNNLHIRKMPKEKYSWEYLKDNKMLGDEMLDYIKDRIYNGYGFLISGKGGSGKSTLLNNMIDEISYSESILVSQESDELYSLVHPQIQFEHTIDKSEGKEEIMLEDELRLGLLQDIDNFVIGEIKGGEALYVFTTALSTGARFFGTIHSNDAASSVKRLAQTARYISDYPMETLEEMLSYIPFVLIHLSDFHIDEILEIDGFNKQEGCLLFHKVYKENDSTT